MKLKAKDIKKNRVRLEQTQEAAAKAIGCSLTTYCRWERAETWPMDLYVAVIKKWMESK